MFKVGDRVKRVKRNRPHAPIGFEADVIAVADNGEFTIIDNEGDRLNVDNSMEAWELVEPDTTKHHAHHDLIIAWAKGSEIEVRAHPSAKWLSTTEPRWYASFEYRIKPTNPDADRIARIECELKRLADELRELKNG